jgi:hypothetical protein
MNTPERSTFAATSTKGATLLEAGRLVRAKVLGPFRFDPRLER